jgi:para-aminobenzoate synthetase/4-amino-4-deoxychorismate lyase
LTLSGAGVFTVECEAFAGRAVDEEMPTLEALRGLPEQLVSLCKTPVQANDPLLQHKTTNRSAYERARSEVPGGGEPIMFNEAGEITESDIANVVYRLEGQYFTPPISSGLLPGTLRGYLLTRGALAERILKVCDFDKVQAIFLLNDLRGWRKVKIAALAD